MEFWLSFNNFQEKLQLPVNPGEFNIKVGNKNTVIDIQNLGDINLIGKEKLAEIQLSSFFPKNFAPYCATQYFPGPYEAVALIEKWRKSGKPIRLIITETPINMACAIEDFEYGERGGTRDVEYTLLLREYRFIQIKKVGEQSQTGLKSPRPDTRPTPKTYTVKSGDTLFLIARKVYGDGSKWRDLYNANKTLIGPDPNLIKPGQQLVIV